MVDGGDATDNSVSGKLWTEGLTQHGGGRVTGDSSSAKARFTCVSQHDMHTAPRLY